MTDDTALPARDQIEPVDLQVEMQRSYLDYAMSVIVSRALPSVRDGLKPVHRRVLYAMYDGGYRPERGHSKCSRVIGDVMGQYHPHGDTAIYDALVRLAQPWSMRYPLVDGQGNFGSRGNDPPAAMRYCVTGETRVHTWDGGSVRIADLVSDAVPNSDNGVDVKVLGKDGQPVRATKLFHSGVHPTLRLRTREGFTLTGTHNHPVLCLVSLGGVPTLLWKLLDETRPGDHVVMQRTPPAELGCADATDIMAAELAGAFVSEGFVSRERAGFNNTDERFFRWIVTAYDAVVGGPRYVSQRRIASGPVLYELDIQRLEHLRTSVLGTMIGHRSATKHVPEFVWRSSPDVKAAFLRGLFTGDGSVSALAKNAIQVSYSTRSVVLADEIQRMLLEFGVVSRQCRYKSGEAKVFIGNRRDVLLFRRYVGFLDTKQRSLEPVVRTIPHPPRSLSADRVPHLAAFLQRSGSGRSWADRDWLRRHNVDRIGRWEVEGDSIRSRLTPEAAAIAEPLVDGRFYYAEVVGVDDAGVQPVYSLRVDSGDHAFVTDGFVSHNTECRMAPLAMEMVRSIDKETVDFSDNYDGKTKEPDVLPARFPNLLVNGAAGIAVGMATSIPPHNLREVASGVQWFLENPEATNEELLAELLQCVQGPDFPTGALIVGRDGIEQAYRTGRGSITMRAVVEIEEDNRGRTILVITELPYQVNPDNLAQKIADLASSGRIQGIADIRDESSARVGQRLVVVLKRDAVAKVVLNNLYKHTQLQDTFGANMLALVEGVPRTLSLDAFVRHWVNHQIDVVIRRTRFDLRKCEERLHIVRALLKAIDRIDEVISLIRSSESAAVAQTALMEFLEIDEVQARAILDMQLRKLAALERQELQTEHDELVAQIDELNAILASPERQRQIVSEELAQIVEKYGDERCTRIVPSDGDMTAEDLIPCEDVVVTITHGGYAKRTKADLYRSQRRGGRGVRGAQLKQDDIVSHFFVTRTHHWILFFTNMGRVYRVKAYELPDAVRDARGQHVANLVAFQPDERIAGVLAIKDYQTAPYLVVATKRGLVKKSRLSDYDSPRAGGLIAVNLREDDELIGARLVSVDDDILLVSRSGMSIRFHATDAMLRPMGRATSGVIGMRFREDDELLALTVARPGSYLFTATAAGYAKRTPVEEWTAKGRGGLGIKAMRTSVDRGALVGALMVGEGDELYAITAGGGVIRTRVTEGELRPLGRDTMGVRLINLAAGDAVVAVAKNAEAAAVDESLDQPGGEDA